MALATIDQIKDGLTARIDALAKELLPAGSYDGGGRYWQDASKARGGLGTSFKVYLTGSRAGRWFYGAGAQSGDVISLIAYLRFADDNRQAVRWARQWLGLDRSAPAGGDPDAARRAREDAQHAARERDRKEQERRRKKTAQARAIWLEAEHRLRDTPAAHYLAGRGIDLSRLAARGGGLPAALRAHPALTYWHVPDPRPKYPALVAAVSRIPVDGAPGEQIATHRIWLAKDDAGRWTKAPVADPKMTLGSPMGGAIYLWRGRRVDPKTGEERRGRRLSDLMSIGPDCPAEATLTVAEGIEDGLIAALAEPWRRIWCGVSLAAMAALPIPGCFERVVLVADNDPLTRTGPTGRTEMHPARKAREKIVAAWQKQGKQVLIAEPAGVKDLNELHEKARSRDG